MAQFERWAPRIQLPRKAWVLGRDELAILPPSLLKRYWEIRHRLVPGIRESFLSSIGGPNFLPAADNFPHTEMAPGPHPFHRLSVAAPSPYQLVLMEDSYTYTAPPTPFDKEDFYQQDDSLSAHWRRRVEGVVRFAVEVGWPPKRDLPFWPTPWKLHGCTWRLGRLDVAVARRAPAGGSGEEEEGGEGRDQGEEEAKAPLRDVPHFRQCKMMAASAAKFGESGAEDSSRLLPVDDLKTIAKYIARALRFLQEEEEISVLQTHEILVTSLGGRNVLASRKDWNANLGRPVRVKLQNPSATICGRMLGSFSVGFLLIGPIAGPSSTPARPRRGRRSSGRARRIDLRRVVQVTRLEAQGDAGKVERRSEAVLAGEEKEKKEKEEEKKEDKEREDGDEGRNNEGAEEVAATVISHELSSRTPSWPKGQPTWTQSSAFEMAEKALAKQYNKDAPKQGPLGRDPLHLALEHELKALEADNRLADELEEKLSGKEAKTSAHNQLADSGQPQPEGLREKEEEDEDDGAEGTAVENPYKVAPSSTKEIGRHRPTAGTTSPKFVPSPSPISSSFMVPLDELPEFEADGDEAFTEDHYNVQDGAHEEEGEDNLQMQQEHSDDA
eukprot:GHVT01037439.1.p1 GENE.GHVT01037439.1~~GHVT01037439.1.p1  ORF type:complete len:634 (+),score=168.49 GHVT01037439.1:68-1903(+)